MTPLEPISTTPGTPVYCSSRPLHTEVPLAAIDRILNLLELRAAACCFAMVHYAELI
jgi:hypothetical protein